MSVINKVRKWLLGLCSKCERKADHDALGDRYCQRCLNDEFQRVMDAEAYRRGID